MKKRETFEFGAEWVFNWVNRNNGRTLAEMVQSSGLVDEDTDSQEAQKTLMQYITKVTAQGLVVATKLYDGNVMLTVTPEGRRAAEAA